VIDLANGKLDAAISALERVQGDVPEALINLGVAYDRKHEPVKALEYWRKAAAGGARFAPLDGWIESKERLWGGR
jgi:hypothetical protein